MADDDFDIIGSLDDIDSQVLGRPVGKSNPKASLENFFGDSLPARRPTTAATSTAAKKSTVSFLDQIDSKPETTTRSALDDLFNEPLSRPTGGPSTSTPATTAISSRPPAGRPRSYGFGGDRGREQKPPENVSHPPPAVAPTTTVAEGTETAARAARLEAEIERLNREIVDLRRQKKEDEEVLEREWKEKLSKRDAGHNEEMEAVRNNNMKQMDKMKSENTEELERMKETYERQLQATQSTIGHSRDVTGMVDKVDELTVTLNRLAGEVGTASEKSMMERENNLRMQEAHLAIREETLEKERTRLDEDKKVVYELNMKMRDMSKEQERTMDDDKWRVREEWNRLAAEKDVFKEDQKFVLEKLEKQKNGLEHARSAFFSEQHDLLVRVSNERSSLDTERSDFQIKRSADLRRLREESTALQIRTRNIQLAEAHVEDLKVFYQNKFRQLHDLEAALMDECMELERWKESHGMDSSFDVKVSSSGRGRVHKTHERKDFAPHEDVPSQEEEADRDDSVRSILKKHSESLQKYFGQKVAAVAPQSNYTYA